MRVAPSLGRSVALHEFVIALAVLSAAVRPGDTSRVRIADEDDELRSAAFAFLDDLTPRTGGFVTRRDLRTFTFKGLRTSLEQNMRGIRVVSGFPDALSILTTYRERPEDRPYEDNIGPDGYPRYKWRGTDASFADNVPLRVAMEERKPLVWFVGVVTRTV